MFRDDYGVPTNGDNDYIHMADDHEPEYPKSCQEMGQRCIAIAVRQWGRPSGRCKKAARIGMMTCNMHAKSYLEDNVVAVRYKFKSVKLQEIYDNHSVNPDYLDLREELALQRTALEATVACIGEEMTTRNVLEISHLIQEINKTALAINTVEKQLNITINIDQMKTVTMQIVNVLAEHISDDDLLEKILLGIDQVNVTTDELASENPMESDRSERMLSENRDDFSDRSHVGGARTNRLGNRRTVDHLKSEIVKKELELKNMAQQDELQ